MTTSNSSLESSSPTASSGSDHLKVSVLGGPTVLIEYGGLRLLTDPTFDAPRSYQFGELTLVKTAPTRAEPEALLPIDAVLLSHDEHPDNLDQGGRSFLAQVPLTLTTASGADRLGGTARALRPWESVQLERPDGGTLTVTGAPALHGPEGCEAVVGEVIGFILTADDLPSVYVSGDNASLDIVRDIAKRHGEVDTAILFAGAVRTPLLDGELLTFDGARAAEAAAILGARRVIPAHVDSWGHFTEGREEFEDAFASAGLSGRLQD